MKNTAIIIPTRLEARRFPNKPLAEINSKPMILHVLNKAKESKVGEVFVATPDKKNFDIVLLTTNNNYKEILKQSKEFKVRNLVINNKKQAAMVPLSDMLNHSMKPDVNWSFDSNMDSFVMKSNKALLKNQEIKKPF